MILDASIAIHVKIITRALKASDIEEILNELNSSEDYVRRKNDGLLLDLNDD